MELIAKNGYRGHNAPHDYKHEVTILVQRSRARGARSITRTLQR